MRISLLKSKTEDYRLRGALRALWEQYSHIISPLSDDLSIEEVFRIVCASYISEPGALNKKEKTRTIGDISKLLYGNRNSWKDVFGYEKEKRPVDYRYESLKKLYSELNYVPEEKKDIIKYLAKDAELTDACQSLETWTEIFDVCESIIVSRIRAGSCSYVCARLMYMLSEKVFQSPTYWLHKNSLNSYQVKELYIRRQKKEDQLPVGE